MERKQKQPQLERALECEYDGAVRDFSATQRTWEGRTLSRTREEPA